MLTVNHSLSLSKAFNTSCMNTIRFLICALFSYFYYACLFLSGLVALMYDCILRSVYISVFVVSCLQIHLICSTRLRSSSNS